jgi:hypothetical protein
MLELVYEESYVKFQRESFFCVVSLLFIALCSTPNQLRDSAGRGGGGECVGFRAQSQIHHVFHFLVVR